MHSLANTIIQQLQWLLKYKAIIIIAEWAVALALAQNWHVLIAEQTALQNLHSDILIKLTTVK